MTGYKAFDKDLKCRGFQFAVGETYQTGFEKENLKLCTNTVFHFCRELHKIEDVSNYTLADSRICEVIATGDIVTDGKKYGTNELQILREIPADELKEYNDSNSGSYNSGNWNSGSYNSGNCNSGDRNSGDRNSGSYNSGSCNSGNCNSGDRNRGNYNSGNYNSGNCNSGNWNSGNWNSGNWNSGFFNTNIHFIRIFDKETKLRRDEINFPAFLYFDLTVWVSHDTATDEEKEKYKKEIETSGGFLKTLAYKDAFRLAWDKADKKEHRQLLNLPNWNNEIFKEISGIDAEAEIAKES